MKPVLEALRVSKAFGPRNQRTEVLDDVSLTVGEGEFVAIVGFSGSGKSTLVNLLAGLLRADSGHVLFGGKRNPEAGPERGLVFQNYSLLPWLSVFENVQLAVDQVFADQSKQDRHARVLQYVEKVGLTPALSKKPSELSGGMRQRVALARTLAMRPSLLLLDEPLGALDALTRASLQDEIARIWEMDRTTVVLVTNDVDEALLLADRIVTLTKGPRATLGREFKVTFERPRLRQTLHHDAAFKALRNEVLVYLNELRMTALSEKSSGQALQPPALVPADLRY